MRDSLKFYRLSDAIFYDRIFFFTTYQFTKPFLDTKCLFLKNMEPLIYNTICLALKEVALESINGPNQSKQTSK